MKTLLLEYDCGLTQLDNITNSTTFEDFRDACKFWEYYHFHPDSVNWTGWEPSKMFFVEQADAEDVRIDERHVCTVYVKPRGIHRYFDWYSAWCHIRSMCEKYERNEMPKYATDREGRF